MFGKSTFLQWEMIALFGYTNICFNLVEERLQCKINLFQFKKKIRKKSSSYPTTNKWPQSLPSIIPVYKKLHALKNKLTY